MYVRTDPSLPDLVLHHSSQAIPEYDNPQLFPGMFPTLFPYGVGGFEGSRHKKISMQAHVNYLLDVADRDTRYHRSFIFVAFNILQRRTAHLKTYLLVQQDRFAAVAERIAKLTPELVMSVANQLQKDNRDHLNTASDSERKVYDLLGEVQSISAKLPGSNAAKIACRAQIRGYMGLFGMPSLFWTCNPSAVHSPIFQVIYGDTSVDLTQRFPRLSDYNERAIRLARDPVAAADFYTFSIRCILQYLFGWDFTNRQSHPQGGLLGHIKAWYG
ncbi:hypothetical protein C8F01DRAFT_995256, partial [Mycena amicta]